MEGLRTLVTAELPRAVADLQQLVRQPSVAAQNLGMAETVALVRAQIEASGGRVEVLADGPGQPVICAEFDGAGDRTLLFYNHYDVQPPEPLHEWTVPPFEGVIRDGRLYGRGVADNKGNIAARLAAIRVLRQRGPLPCKVRFLIEGEEEIGSPHLEGVIARHAERFAADACIWEFGGVDPEDRPQVYGGVKGICYLQLWVRAAEVDMHSSYAAVVENAAWRLTWALASIKGPDGRVRVPGFYDGIIPPSPRDRALAARIPFNPETLRTTYGLRRPLLTEGTGRSPVEALCFEPTCTICGLESGYYGPGSKTVLPKAAQAKIDCRMVPGQDPEEICRRFRAHLDAEGFTDVEVELIGGELAYMTDAAHPFVELVLATAEAAWGRPPVYHPISAGTGPMHPFGHILKLPVVSTGAGYYGSRAHAPDEHIRLADLEKGILHMAHLLEQFGGR